MLYNTSEVFSEPVRLSVFRDLVFKKYFFVLFLHWEDAVRSAFYQLLAFKVLRNKRSSLVERRSSGVSVVDASAADQTVLTDRLLSTKMEAYVNMIKEQDHKPELVYFAPDLRVYARRAVAQYQSHLKRYLEWEVRGLKEKPPMLEIS
eukprot:TRINITY_DN4988_c0_g1_i3.p2 TRINITY_DN4988_c0_g1~~TRINITY_DN4988_c0_g1_i3.p2  ORF type:complete len:148 (-),score=46.26 TRINITY_DN4988_c0_g1_i3:134-577(-)